jgi:RNA binding exosome subunit
MIHYIFLRVSAQATEDPEKVRSAIGLFLPPAEDESKLKGSDIISEYVTSGYYGNKIILMEAELHKKKTYSVCNRPDQAASWKARDVAIGQAGPFACG